ncbi:MAG: hypothetical protein EBX41_01430 [Chitinophagia bacterium]|nr:hypothetical protein [Chitinophagia bacterium]
MKKVLLHLCLLTATLTGGSVYAQSYYAVDSAFIDLDNLKWIDSAALPPKEVPAAPVADENGNIPAPPETDTIAIPSWDFKRAGKYANRFTAFSLNGNVPLTAVYKGRTFRIVDETKMAYKISAKSKEINVKTNTDDDAVLDSVPGNQFLISSSEGIILVQRYDQNIGYRITKYNEWGRPAYKKTIPHTPMNDKGKPEGEPYLFYFSHTDRFMAFTSLSSRATHRAVVIDLKDGKYLPIGATICGCVRAPNEIQYMGYLVRDEPNKALKVNIAGSAFSLKENNITKVVGEALLNDTTLVLARYYTGMAGINLAAFHAKTGRLVWQTGTEMVQPKNAPTIIYLSQYKNELIMEGEDPTTGKYVEIFNIDNGKRMFSTIQP